MNINRTDHRDIKFYLNIKLMKYKKITYKVNNIIKKPTARWWWRWKQQLRILDFERESVTEGMREWTSLIYIYLQGIKFY